MSQMDLHDEQPATEGTAAENEGVPAMPASEVARRRAQLAHKQVEDLTAELAGAREQAGQSSRELARLRAERELMHKLAAAGATDLEAAVLLAQSRMADQTPQNTDAAVERLRRDKPWLFAAGRAVTPSGTAGPRDRARPADPAERAARRAAATGRRADVHEYQRIRRRPC